MTDRTPATCPACGDEGTVALETSVSGAIVQMLWWCRRCNTSWSVKRREETHAAPDARPD